MLAWFKSLFDGPDKKKKRRNRAYQKRVRERERQLRKKLLGEENVNTTFYFKPYGSPTVRGGRAT
ncbi:Acetyl-CoA carboxylase [Penicillium atrosanguineum]|uniref:Uncharacterized protein n=1 Tax=Penicillium atrosanguineum TaxID=1132637 RepID=A0A9W9PWP8_9EURO|nr:Acetyl-CoA carboxylase [Penicillium atrosanguineum]KAJ5122721.1 hypothetical protein N7526_009658 [Penicillium atrosanguineum]KAJ5310360.1 Acetyl-CoA carboxylase [Penicillium atrosanguineum]KAJ5315881.1 hypothetical protein N7476_006188 [Penicillium atrosanguineum]